MFYGLDWIATVPPTVRLTSDAFGRENTGVLYGWIGAYRQLGASVAALIAGTVRLGHWSLCFLTGFVFLFCRQALERSARLPVPSLAPV